MNRFIVLVFFVISILFLTGCSTDARQAATIHKTLEESAALENGFIAKQENLMEIKADARELYNDLVNLHINDQDTIQEKLEEANTLIEKQEKLLKEAEENFQTAYEKLITIEENIEKIKDHEQKNQALELLTVIEERKALIDSYFENYHKSLKVQQAFYQNIKDENYNMKTLDGQIHDINERNQDMEKMIEQFNQYTKQFLKEADDYKQMI